MLLFLTGHWWLYRQVLWRGCNYPGRAWSLPNPHPHPGRWALHAPLLPGPQQLLQRPCSGIRARQDASESRSKFPLLRPRGPSPRGALASSIPLAGWFRLATLHPSLISFPSRSAPDSNCPVSPRPSPSGPGLEALGGVATGKFNVKKLIITIILTINKVLPL